jgi:hypothetical protein
LFCDASHEHIAVYKLNKFSRQQRNKKKRTFVLEVITTHNKKEETMNFVVSSSLSSLKLFVKSLQCLHRVSPHLLMVATPHEVRRRTWKTKRKKRAVFTVSSTVAETVCAE